MSERPKLTDRAALKLHRARAQRRPETFLFDEAAADLEERLIEVKKDFRRPALVGDCLGTFTHLAQAAKVIADEDVLDLKEAAHDLVIHAMSLHWSDDPVGQLVQARRALEPDGLFIATFFGGQTLHELRSTLAEAETAVTGGLSPRVVPMGDLRDLGALLQRAGFALPVADSRAITVRYPDLIRLVNDLRGMGETNALAQRHKRPIPRRVWDAAERIYRQHFSDDDGYITATFELITLTGWSPAASQPQPLRPGSATHRLADVLGTEEQPTGDKTTPEQS